MGVRGWNSLLAREGWLVQRETPDGVERPDLLWMNPRDPHHSSLLRDHLESIPSGSELHVDGMGLSFHLHAAAYERHVASANLTGSSMHLVRTFVPLQALHDITREFVEGLQSGGIQEIVVYWDGRLRPRFKAETQKNRQSLRDEEWVILQNYCRSGGRLQRKGLSKTLPISPLALQQIRYTLSLLKTTMIQCDGEADIEMARAVTRNPRRFVAANDTDFCFMEKISYIPFSTLHIVEHNVVATVLRRNCLSESFDLANEALLVEAALMLGNDYYQPDRFMSAQDVIAYLQEQTSDFRVVASNERDGERLDFVRALYRLEEPVWENNDAITELETDLNTRENSTKPSYRMSKVCLEPLTKQARYDSSKDALIDCLERYLEEEPSDFSREHLQAFIDMHTDASATLSCPKWSDVVASFVLECTITRLYRSECLPAEAPYEIYPSAIQFLEALHRNRNANVESLQVRICSRGQLSGTSAPSVLPVDEFEGKIIDSVQRNRVTIIQGGTGCGKSTRVPLMLLKQSPTTKIFICQPRRLAVKSIVDYLRRAAPESLRDSIALRMGHGIREYESNLTRAWFVTTGYLVRLLANAPQRFDSVNVLIIDEVHERSVDTDILCLLCKRLMITNRSIRLVLMSATMAATMYQTYFEAPEPPIQVGFKRYPIKEFFIEDIVENLDLPANEEAALDSLGKACLQLQGKETPTFQYMDKLCESAASLATIIGNPGSSVLVFVSGMFDIVRVSEAIGKIFIANKRITCCPIHSEIPFEEQQLALMQPKVDEVKIIVATNAAESSLTIPEVDNVICLGLCKQLTYNSRSHRQMLVPAWISKANAIQRAGRTGRVAPGTVYRLYPRSIYEHCFEPFEKGEMLRIPLDSVVLMLKEIIPQSESVTNVLRNCLEPPDLGSIDNSLLHLHKARLTTTAIDDCEITELGKFVLALGIDLTLGCLVGLGIQFGVGPEAIQLAGILACDKGPWLMSNPLVHPVGQYNETTRLSWSAKVAHENHLFSDTFSCMDLLHEFKLVASSERRQWCLERGVFLPRLIRMQSTCQDLATRVASFLRIDDSHLRVLQPPRLMQPAKVQILRIVQVWAFPQNIIRFGTNVCRQLYGNIDEQKRSLTMVLRKQNGTLTEDHLDSVLQKDVHPFTLFSQERARVHGTFELPDADRSETDEARSERLWSYSADKNLAAAWYQYPGGKKVRILRRNDFILNDELIQIAIGLRANSSMFVITDQTAKNLRGIKERACGRWVAVPFDFTTPDVRAKYSTWEVLDIFAENLHANISNMQQEFQRSAANCRADVASLFFPRQKEKSKRYRFEFVLTGSNRRISDQDLKDVLMSQRVAYTCEISSPGTSELIFIKPENESSSHSLYPSIPHGARLFLTIASGWRSQHIIQFPKSGEKQVANSSETSPETEGDSISVLLPEWAKLGSLWKTFDVNSDPLDVVIDSSSTAASAVPLVAPSHEMPVYAVCGIVLELRKGLKVSNLTILPPENHFLCLAQLSFGLISVEELSTGTSRGDIPALPKVLAASNFNQSCSVMGEQLQCFPKKVAELLSLFSSEENSLLSPELMKDLDDSPLTASNLLKHQKAHKEDLRIAKATKTKERENSSATTRKKEDIKQNVPAQLEKRQRLFLAQLFATESSKPLDSDKLYASNLMSLILHSTRGTPLCLDDWQIVISPCRHWRAYYSEAMYLPANSGCAWDVTDSNPRPIQINEALRCLPPKMRPFYFHKMKSIDASLMFESLEVAIQMEAVFWLERQFHTPEAHWYQRGAHVGEMIRVLQEHMKAAHTIARD